MPIADYALLQRYNAIDPIVGGDMLDVLFATLKYTIAQVQSSKTLDVNSFRVFTEPAQKTDDQILDTLKMAGFKEE